MKPVEPVMKREVGIRLATATLRSTLVMNRLANAHLGAEGHEGNTAEATNGFSGVSQV